MKLKKIDIQAFRAYQDPGDGTFDFTNPNDETSNFITIYAPNGFGKTSFYDAIEWGFTNSVGRLQKDGKNILKIAKEIEDDKYIYRNKLADDSIDCKVDIHLVDKVTPITNFIDHKKIRKGQKDTKLSETEENNNFSFIKDVILSQDGISSFLREDDAQIRYDKFVSKFGDIELSEQYKNLQKVFEHNKREERAIKSKIKEVQSNIDSDIDANFIDEINEQLQTLDPKFNSLLSIRYPYSEKDLYDFKNELLAGQEKIKKEIGNIEESISSVDNILSGSGKVNLSEYNSNKVKLSRDKKRLSDLDFNLIVARKLTSLSESKEISETILSEEKETLDVIESALSRHEEYVEAVELILDKELEIKNLSKNDKDISGKIDSLRKKLEIDKNNHLSNIKDMQVKQQNLENSDYIFERIDYCNKEVSENKSAIKEINRLKAEHSSVIDNCNVTLNILNRAMAYNNEKNFHRLDDLDDDIYLLFNDIKIIYNKRDEVEDKVRILNRDAVFENELDKSIQEVASKAIDIIKRNEHSNCPVCATSFSDTQTLIDSILITRRSIHSNSTIKRDLAEYQNELNELNREIDEKSKIIERTILQKINEVERVKFDAEQWNLELEREIKIAEKKITDLNAELQEKLSHTRLSDKLDYKSHLDIELDLISEKNHELTKLIDDNSENLSILLKEKATSEQRLLTLSNDIKQLKESHRILIQRDNYDKLSVKYNVSYIELTNLKERFSRNLSYSLEDILLYSNEIESLRMEANATDIDEIEYEYSLLTNDINRMEAINLHIEKIISTELGLELLPGSEKVIESLLLSSLSNKRDEVINLNCKFDDFSKVKSYLDNALPYLNLVESRKTIEELEKRLSFLVYKVRPKLLEEINRVGSHINDKISSFFYEDLINELYKRVDPHPDYVEIKFVCEISYNDKPKLHVVCKKKGEENNRIIPSLYFSSGQLNALSLCIFLAKALNVSYDNGKTLDFILIDDPVQAMDGMNILSTIDLLRGISISHNKQIILSTHDESLFNLIQKKIPEEVFGSKFITLESHGKVAQVTM